MNQANAVALRSSIISGTYVASEKRAEDAPNSLVWKTVEGRIFQLRFFNPDYSTLQLKTQLRLTQVSYGLNQNGVE